MNGPHVSILSIALIALGACATSTPIAAGDPQPLRSDAPASGPLRGDAPAGPLRSDATTSESLRGYASTSAEPTVRAIPEDRDREHQPWEFTIAGSGASDQHFNAGNAGLNGSIGYYFNEVFELSARQNVSFGDAGVGAGDVWNFGSFVAVDFNIPIDRFVPFVGANIGYIYGDSVDDSWAAGPEAGMKFYFKPDVFLLVGAQWEFNFDSNSTLSNAFDDGTIYYNIGLGARF